MARKRESLWAAYSFLKLLLPVAIFGPATPLLYATCTNMLTDQPHNSELTFNIPSMGFTRVNHLQKNTTNITIGTPVI